MEALNTSLARVSRLAMQCAESLAAVAAVASDPQVRAVLAHRANVQRCAANELMTRAGEGADVLAPPPAQARRRDAGQNTPPIEGGELPLLRYAAQQASRRCSVSQRGRQTWRLTLAHIALSFRTLEAPTVDFSTSLASDF